MLDSEPVFVGLNNVVTLMPNNPLLVVDGERYARFRFSTAGGLGPTGEAPDGEVEDYKLIVSGADPFEDWGDAPLSYGTVWPFGAGHTPDPLLRLGTAFDLEGDGQPSDAADGDDLAGGIDDEDGVTFGPFIPGRFSVIRPIRLSVPSRSIRMFSKVGSAIVFSPCFVRSRREV